MSLSSWEGPNGGQGNLSGGFLEEKDLSRLMCGRGMNKRMKVREKTKTFKKCQVREEE